MLVLQYGPLIRKPIEEIMIRTHTNICTYHTYMVKGYGCVYEEAFQMAVFVINIVIID